MFVNIGFGMFLVLLAAVLIGQHWQTWRAKQQEPGNERERQFAWCQFRRRMQVSAMLGIVGIGLIFGQLFSVSPAALVYWIIMAFAVLWIMLLAIADLISTRMYLTELKRERLVEQARLRAELQQHTKPDSNAEPGDLKR